MTTQDSKSRAPFAFVLACLLAAGCDNSVALIPEDSDSVAEDTAGLQVQFALDGAADAVVTDVELETNGNRGSTIVWNSDAPTTVAVDGEVLRPASGAGNGDVELVATVTKGLASESKTFSVTVVEAPTNDAECIADDKSVLEISFADSNDATGVTQDLDLDANGSCGTLITWQSSDSTTISSIGLVQRPASGAGNAEVVLTATISKNGVSDTKSFSVTVLESPASEAEAVSEDTAALEIGYGGSDSAGNVTQNLALPTSGANGTSISWSSDNPEAVTDEGIIARPVLGSGDEEVVLTATIEKNGISNTKTFIANVRETPSEDSDAVATDTAALEIGFGPSDSFGNVTEDLWLSGSGSSGTTVTWSTDNPDVVTSDGMVHRPSLGSENMPVTLTATIEKNDSRDTKSFLIVVKANTPTDEEAVAIDLAALEIGYDESDSSNTVTENVLLSNSGDLDTVISWVTDSPDIIAIDGSVTRPAFLSGDAQVTLTATVERNGVSSDKSFNLLVIAIPPTDAEAVSADLAALEISYAEYNSATRVTENVALPMTGAHGTSITWFSETPSLMADDGTVTRPTAGEGDATAVLIANVELNGIVDTEFFNLTVLESGPFEYVIGSIAFNIDLAECPEGYELATWETEADLAALISLCQLQTVDCFTQYTTIDGAHVSVVDGSPMPNYFSYFQGNPVYQDGREIMVRHDFEFLLETQSAGLSVCGRRITP